MGRLFLGQRLEGLQSLLIIRIQKPFFKHGSRMNFFKRAMASMAKMKRHQGAFYKSLPSEADDAFGSLWLFALGFFCLLQAMTWPWKVLNGVWGFGWPGMDSGQQKSQERTEDFEVCG